MADDDATMEELFGGGDDEDFADPAPPEPVDAEPEHAHVDKKEKKDKKDGKDKEKKQKKDGKEKKDKKEKRVTPSDVASDAALAEPAEPVLPVEAPKSKDKPEKKDSKEKKGKKDGKEKEKEKDKKRGKEKKDKKRKHGESDDGGAAAGGGDDGFNFDEFNPLDEVDKLFEQGGDAGKAPDDMFDDFVKEPGGTGNMMESVFGEDFFADNAEAEKKSRKDNARRLSMPPKARKKAKVVQQHQPQAGPEEPTKFNDKLMMVLDNIKIRKPLAIKENEAVKFVQRSIEEMLDMAKADEECFGTDKPASYKMRMLPKVITIMNKYQFAVHFITNEGCKALAAWLRPLPDGRLPNDHLRTELLRSMTRLPITKEALAACPRELSLGKIVAHLQHHPQETVDNRKLAGELVQKWVKQVLAKQPDLEDMEESEAVKPKLIRPAPETIESVQEMEKEAEKRIHPSIPIIEGKEYLIKPIPRHQPVRREKVATDTNRGKIGEVLKVLARPNKRSWKPYEVSVAGRNVNAI